MKSKDNVKTRFKLYKAGKMWLIAGTTFLALAGLGSVAVHADSNNLNTQSAQSTVATNQDVKVESTQSQDNNVVTVQNNDVTTPAQTDSSKQDNSATDSKNATPAQSDSNKQDNSATDNKNATPAQTDSNKQDNSAAENKNATPAQSDSNKQDNSATDSKDATPAQSDSNKQDNYNKNAADQANSTSVNSDTTSNTDANNQKVALLAADNQTDGWNTDHTQYTQGGQLLTGVHNIDGTYYDFDENHNIVKNNYVQSQWGLWYMFGNDGRIATKVTPWAGTYYYFDPLTYLRVDNNYVQSQWGLWYMFGNDGRIVTGLVDWYGSKYYFDENTYTKVTNDWRDTYLGHAHFNADGVLDAVSDAQKAQQLENIADQFLGWGYVWGGNNPSTGFDCSGLTQYIMSQIGISIARTASDQYANSRHISAGQAQKGDLVYFCEGGSVIHTGLYIGNGLMIDAQVAGVGIGVHRVSQLSSYYPAVYGRYLNL